MDRGHDYACGGEDHLLSRRTLLGAMAGVGLGGLMTPAAAERLRAKAKQVIFIWLDGGISQLESWDPKPDTEFSGPFRAIPTSLDGVMFSELVPETAKRAHKLTIVRNMCTKDENHSSGVPRMLRGDPINRGVDYPYIGSAVSRLLGPLDPGLPPYIWVKPGSGGFIWQHAGFLGPRYGALALGDGKPPANVRRPDTLSEARAQQRNELRRLANERFRRRRVGSDVDAYEYSYDLAEKLMKRKDLFDDSRIKPKDSERYGTHPLGRHILRARGLIEAGVRFVQVHSYHWDTHSDNFGMHLALAPQIDRPLAALVDDLDERGMLDRVLVVVMSEFGRTPKINQRFGRDHWPEAWSLLLAGGGIKRGAVIGRTTPDGVWVDGPSNDAGHLFHTIFHVLGIEVNKTDYEHKGQSLAIARDDCSLIKEALA